MSPVTLRRHADRFGTSTPNSVSMRRSVELRSVRLEAELAWHDEFLAALPKLVAPDQEQPEP
jgi:hypothetical protein